MIFSAWRVVWSVGLRHQAQVLASFGSFIVLRLCLVLMMIAAIRYQPGATPALLGFLFANGVVFDAIAHRFFLLALTQATEAGLARRGEALGPAAAASPAFTEWAADVQRMILYVGRVCAAGVMILLFAVYLLVLAPATLLIAVPLCGGVALLARRLRKAAEERQTLARMTIILANPFWQGGKMAAPLRTYTGHLHARTQRALTERTAALGALVGSAAGFLAIAAPVLPGMTPERVGYVAAVSLLLWVTALGLIEAPPAPTALAPSGSAPVVPLPAPSPPASETDAPDWQEIRFDCMPTALNAPLTLTRGSVTLLWGGNGAGKSLLLAHLSGRLPAPTGFETPSPPPETDASSLPAEETLPPPGPRLSAWEGVVTVGQMPPRTGLVAADWLYNHAALIAVSPALPDFLVPAERCATLREILTVTGLPTNTLDADGVLRCADLPRAFRARVALALALLDPDLKLLLLDGFLDGQDPAYRAHFARVTLDYLRLTRRCTLLASSDSALFESADRRLHLVQGRLADV